MANILMTFQFQNQILKKMGSPIMTNLYYGTVKQILERVSSVMIDREAIQCLVGYVMEVGQFIDFWASPKCFENLMNKVT